MWQNAELSCLLWHWIILGGFVMRCAITPNPTDARATLHPRYCRHQYHSYQGTYQGYRLHHRCMYQEYIHKQQPCGKWNSSTPGINWILLKAEIEPMWMKQGPGTNAANLQRKESKFDELLLELVNQLKASEKQFHNATDKFNQNGFLTTCCSHFDQICFLWLALFGQKIEIDFIA